MRTCRNKFFNQLFQPERIGKQILKPKRQLVPLKRTKKSLIEKCRTMNQSRANKTFAKKVLIGLRIRYNRAGLYYLVSPSKFSIARYSYGTRPKRTIGLSTRALQH